MYGFWNHRVFEILFQMWKVSIKYTRTEIEILLIDDDFFLRNKVNLDGRMWMENMKVKIYLNVYIY